jgi:hypothetical protein
MTATQVEILENQTNPLDLLEQVAEIHDWPSDRLSEEELLICAPGSWCHYQLTITYRADLESLHIAAAFDLHVPKSKRTDACMLVARINEQLWLGHFDLWSDAGTLIFRHGLILSGNADVTPEQCEGLIDIATEACERYYPSFQFLIWAGKKPEEALAAALFETQGHA